MPQSLPIAQLLEHILFCSQYPLSSVLSERMLTPCKARAHWAGAGLTRTRTAATNGVRNRVAFRPRLPTLRSRAQASAEVSVAGQKLFQELGEILEDYKRAPPSLKQEVTADVLQCMQAMAGEGLLRKWGAALADLPDRRNVLLGELRLVGIKAPDSISKVSVRNDAAFLFSVVMTTSVLAVVLGQLPGDWGFFSSYLVGSLSFVVLGIGSVNPGILQFAIDKFSQVYPDYKERVLRHEAAHLLVAYLLGVPVGGYSLSLGTEHTDLAEAKLQKRLIERTLDAREVDVLSIIAMAGATSEAQQYEEVIGQNADLSDLQRIMLRSANKMGDAQQQNQTRWAVYQAATLLRTYQKEYQAVQEAMAKGAGVAKCIEAIEAC